MLRIETPATPATRVFVIGGGAAGVMAARRLLDRAGETGWSVDVSLIEASGDFGPGLAYRTTHPGHRVNNYAGRLSAVDGEPDHLVRWCRDQGLDVGPTSFPTRAWYGAYLRDLLDSASVPPGCALSRISATVVDVREAGSLMVLTLSDGRTFDADHVVLAVGTPPPRELADYEALADRQGATYVPDPWQPGALDRVRGVRRVLLVGTGQTMVDALISLHDASPETHFVAVSRRGVLPSTHRPGSLRLHDVFHPGTQTLADLVDAVRTRSRELEEIGGDWRDVVDSVRAVANELWAELSDADQDAFARDVARTWEAARHRLSPQVAALLAELQDRGVLQVRTTADVPPGSYDAVVDCAGPRPVPSLGWSPLIDRLLEAGLIRPHRLGLGLDLTAAGHPVGRDGLPRPRLHVMGVARRGREWEVQAIPDLRTQSTRVAHAVVPAGGAWPSALSETS